MSLNSIQNYGFKTASIACHGIGYTADAATEVATTAKNIGTAATALLSGLVGIDAIKSVVYDEETVTQFEFPTRLSGFCKEATYSVLEKVIHTNDDGTTFEQDKWSEVVSDPCARYNINTTQILFPVVFVATMHLLAKASPLIAKNAHDLGNYFSDLSGRAVAQIK